MPGHIGTSIPLNTRKVQSGNQSDATDATQIAQARARIASTGEGRFGSVGRRGSEDRPGFRYVLIAHSSAAFRASRTASFFLIAAISLRILCNSLWDFLLSKYSEPSCATMYRSNWLLRTSEVGVAPYRSFSKFKFSSLDTLHDEIAGYAIFFLGRHVAKDCALAIPFTVFRHI